MNSSGELLSTQCAALEVPKPQHRPLHATHSMMKLVVGAWWMQGGQVAKLTAAAGGWFLEATG
jgi:hypothetical protein